MFEIFKSMIKEEWRLHSNLFGNNGFSLFPFFIFLFTFFVSLMLPIFSEIFTYAQIALRMHYLFLLLGGMIGVGLMGKEFMNRRFGQASLIAYSSRTLPVSERLIFANFLMKDIVYYFVLYVLPFIAGFALAAALIPKGNFHFPVTLLVLLLTLSLSFMIGLSLVFFLSTIYAHSGKLLTWGLLAGCIFLLFISGNLDSKISYSLPSLSFFLLPSKSCFLLSSGLVIIPSVLSLFFLKVDFPQAKKSFSNSFAMLCKEFVSYRYAAFVAKDFLDLKRSEGGIGKLVFSLLLPAALIWMLLSALGKVLPALNIIILFSLVLGVLSSSMYNWLTEYDIFASYAFLPLKVSDMIRSKLNSYLFLNLVPLIILILLTLKIDPVFLLPALLLFFSISLYMVSILIYLTGLSPSINLYNGRTFAVYTLSVMPLLLVNIVLSMFGPYYVLLNLLLLPPSLYLLGQSFRKWDRTESPRF
ncbi:hypothetical protein MSBRW_1878 [Methanosarcina barkeri str. Wiesmoor]|uniref:Uncharacterized protein n=2 Tax=Methanosarcina barkeri TaxID=2208 RepID=A0A0E3LLE5_METBA|nr:hypothetical protein [Methanosarcina barkeri]AKB51131.1 hypothetical protein MSBRW_1878 [Methanosarcina barkeri str. Wiesmoor]